MSEANVSNENTKGARKVRSGYVVSDKMSKTIVVELEDRKKHALYGKIMRANTKVKAHDENETAGIGDFVRIEDPAAVQGQALPSRRDHREGQVVLFPLARNLPVHR